MTPRDGTGHLVRGSVVLAGAMAINGLGGLAFWCLAAVQDDAATVGAAQQLFVGLTVVGCLTSMGLPVAVARFCRDRDAEAVEIWHWSVAYSATTSVIGAVALWLLAPGSMLHPFDAVSGLLALGTLALLVVGMSLAVLVEVRLVGLRRWGWVLSRAGLVALLRLPLLFTEVGASSGGLLVLAAGLPAISGLVGAIVLRAHDPARAGWWRRPTPAVRPWFGFASVNFLALLGTQGPMFVIPFVVALHLDSADYAPFYLAWATTQMVFMVPHMFGQVFLAEAGRAEADPDHQVQLMLRLGVGVTAAALEVSLLLGPDLARWLGTGYSEVALLLPWLLGGCVPWAVTSVLVARARLADRSQVVVTITTTFCVTTLGAVAVAAPSGALSVARAWVVANVVTMAIGLVASPIGSVRSRPADPLTPPRPLDLEVSLGQ